MNADDYYVPGCFRRAASAAQRFPNAAVVYGDGFTVDGDGRLLKRVVSTTFSAKRFVYGGSLVLQQSSYYRSDAFRAIGGFKTENRTSWDAELLLDMSLRDMTLVYVSEYWSNKQKQTKTNTDSQRLAEESRKTHARYFRAVMGREKKSLDKLAAKFVFAYTLLTEPRGLLTRVSDRLRSVISNPKTKKLGQKHLAYRG